MLTNRGFAFAMARICAAYNRELTEFQQQTYRDHLGELTDEQLMAAIEHAIDTSEYVPTVARLRSFVYGDGKDRARAALRDVERLIGSKGGLLEHVDVRVLPPATWKAALAVGLGAIRNADEFTRKAVEQEYVAAYSSAEIEERGKLPSARPGAPRIGVVA